MTLYRVRNPQGISVWLAYVDDELRVWSYVQNTSMFHLNRGLFLDFNVEHHNTYEPIDVMTARSAIHEGLGTLDPKVQGHLARQFFADSGARSKADVLGHARREDHDAQ